MTNTQRYYATLKEWREGMKELGKAYQEKLAEYEPYRGSEGYDQALAELDKIRADGMEAVRKEYHDRFDAIIADMERAYQNKPMTAPTTEQVNLLSALKLRTSIGRDELRQAANTLKDCPVARETLREIAGNLGVTVGIAQEISGSTVTQHLRTLRSHTAEMLGMSKVDDRKSHVNSRAANSGTLFLIDRDFTDEADCMRIMALATDPVGFANAVN